VSVLLFAGRAPAPPVTIPTRAELLAVQTTGMQGLTLDGHPFLDFYITSPDYDAATRQRAYDLKHSVGDTHCLVALSWNYQEAGAYAPAGFDGTKDWPRFLGILDEVIAAGFFVSLHLAGDGLSMTQGPPWNYNDPVGWTYGWQWLTASFPDIHAQIGPTRAPFILWCPGFDGCVPGWAGPENNWHRTNEWIQRCRSIIGPDAVLMLYLSSGYWAWSGETNDYATADGQQVDGVYYEGPIPFGPPAPYPGQDSGSSWDQIWQISKRLLYSAYVRPPDQPADDDPGTIPGSHQTPRGPMVPIFLEFATYPWVRPGHISADTVAWQRAYVKALGFPKVG
jgi:hypothetical protein